MGNWAKTALRIIRLAGICSVLISGGANAGPPFRTDDPEPVETGHYEFYTFMSGTHVIGGTAGVGPAFEFNYGIIPDGQLHIIAPVGFTSPVGGPTMFGYGDTEIGFKYRFIQEDKDGWRPMVGTFPMVELATGDVTKGLGVGHTRLFLPLWVQKSWGDWQTYGGGGYWINRDDTLGDKNYWYAGWQLQRKITEKLTLGGEVFYQTATSIFLKDSAGFNLGGIYDVDEHNHILFSAGRGFHNASETNLYSWYLAWQITR
jgi:subtilisin family serine protease